LTFGLDFDFLCVRNLKPLLLDNGICRPNSEPSPHLIRKEQRYLISEVSRTANLLETLAEPLCLSITPTSTMNGTPVNDPSTAAASAGSSLPAEEVEVDLMKLNALSPEVISKQATVSIILHPACNSGFERDSYGKC